MERPEIVTSSDLGVGVTRGRSGFVNPHSDEGVKLVVQPRDRIETFLDHLGDRCPAGPDSRCAFDDTHDDLDHGIVPERFAAREPRDVERADVDRL